MFLQFWVKKNGRPPHQQIPQKVYYIPNIKRNINQTTLTWLMQGGLLIFSKNVPNRHNHDVIFLFSEGALPTSNIARYCTPILISTAQRRDGCWKIHSCSFLYTGFRYPHVLVARISTFQSQKRAKGTGRDELAAVAMLVLCQGRNLRWSIQEKKS